MFISPISDATEWNYTPVLLTVPADNVLRYPKYQLNGIHISNGDIAGKEVSLPVTSYVKIKIDTDANTTWIELEPLLVSDPALARKFVMGFPTIYIVFDGVITTLMEGFISMADLLGTVTDFSFAIQFSDRIERDISLAADTILGLIQDTGTPAWGDFCTALKPQADISFLNANGKSLKEPINLRFTPEAGTARNFEYIPFASKLSELINNETGTLELTDPGADGPIQILWTSITATGVITVNYESIAINSETRIILFARLYEYFAHQTREAEAGHFPNFTIGNRVTTFVNGPDYYKDIFAELNKVNTADARFFLTGYSMFQDNELVNKDEFEAHTILEAAQKIVALNGQCNFLPLQFTSFKSDGPGWGIDNVMQVAVMLGALLQDIGIYTKYDSTGNTLGQDIISASVLASTMSLLYYAKNILASGYLEEHSIKAGAKVDKLNFDAGVSGKSRSIWALHPAVWEDNSFTRAGGNLVDFINTLINGATAYHHKLAIVKNSDWIAYCGGIDLNENRMDDAAHLNKGPYHDVHARITGPAVREIATTFIERWNDEIAKGHGDAGSGPIDEPTLLTIPETGDGYDIVQVARTIFKARDGSGRSFSYAPNGDRTIIDTMILSMKNAKEYIYIEDQYFTPSPEYMAALHEALDNGLKSLVIMICGSADQIFSETIRAKLVENLLARNIDPLNPVVRIGYARRAYISQSTTSEVLTGRMKLGKDLSATDDEILLGPVTRIPAVPFWLSVNGEVMLVKGTTLEGTEVGGTEDEPDPETDDTYQTYQHYAVERGDDTYFFKDPNSFSTIEKGYKRRKHKHGDPATAVLFSGIYIHAKCMMVDDVFASIGSANLNRRGFYSDTETNIFFIPDSLRFDPANAVALLRKQLWAEWLNIPTSMGKGLLNDPVAASKLFDRDTATGNRFVPYQAVSKLVKSYLGFIGNISLSSDTFSMAQVFKAEAILTAYEGEAIVFDDIFFHITDPSSFTENPPEPL